MKYKKSRVFVIMMMAFIYGRRMDTGYAGGKRYEA